MQVAPDEPCRTYLPSPGRRRFLFCGLSLLASVLLPATPGRGKLSRFGIRILPGRDRESILQFRPAKNPCLVAVHGPDGVSLFPGLPRPSGTDSAPFRDPVENPPFVLNRTASALWNLCDGDRTVGEIGRSMTEIFEVSPETALRDAIETVRLLYADHLLLGPTDSRG